MHSTGKDGVDILSEFAMRVGGCDVWVNHDDLGVVERKDVLEELKCEATESVTVGEYNLSDQTLTRSLQ